MGKIERSWELVKASWSVLRTDKELLVFPLVSAIAVCVVMATFAVPMFLAGIFDGTIASAAPLPFLGIVLGFAFYVVQYMVIFYCNSALMGAGIINAEALLDAPLSAVRSEERRVGKECNGQCRSRWSPYH